MLAVHPEISAILTSERAAMLAREAGRLTDRPLRRRFGFWLVVTGLRLAHGRPATTSA